MWGELESESEEEESEESESDDEKEAPPDTADASGLITPADGGLVTPSGVTSVPVGMETPDMIELRKKRIEDSMDQGGDTPALYQVLKEKTANVGGAMMGSAHVYDLQVRVVCRNLCECILRSYFVKCAKIMIALHKWPTKMNFVPFNSIMFNKFLMRLTL